MWIEPVTLEGRYIRLEPLSPAHVPALWAATAPEIYRFKPYAVNNEDDMHGFVARLQRMQADGEGLGFATIDRATGAAVGSSSYFAADAQHRRLEIGVQTERLGETAVLRRIHLPTRHQRAEIILHRLGIVLLGERRRRLARA